MNEESLTLWIASRSLQHQRDFASATAKGAEFDNLLRMHEITGAIAELKALLDFLKVADSVKVAEVA